MPSEVVYDGEREICFSDESAVHCRRSYLQQLKSRQVAFDLLVTICPETHGVKVFLWRYISVFPTFFHSLGCILVVKFNSIHKVMQIIEWQIDALKNKL